MTFFYLDIELAWVVSEQIEAYSYKCVHQRSLLIMFGGSVT